ncbi:putative sulfate transporter 3.4 [Panicum miliaceum]|uniref:Sulfate transporter 3.4 n=1 Tax=Panicum miliaceum TaxID=4540 RepID=A0A3L6R0A5_PANMI|nr:putative sulfate transporter 3.4 [Panicum miliaceum]
MPPRPGERGDAEAVLLAAPACAAAAELVARAAMGELGGSTRAAAELAAPSRAVAALLAAAARTRPSHAGTHIGRRRADSHAPPGWRRAGRGGSRIGASAAPRWHGLPVPTVQGISYAKLANLPPIIDSSFVPPLMGSSRNLAVGPVSIALLAGDGP